MHRIFPDINFGMRYQNVIVSGEFFFLKLPRRVLVPASSACSWTGLFSEFLFGLFLLFSSPYLIDS